MAPGHDQTRREGRSTRGDLRWPVLRRPCLHWLLVNAWSHWPYSAPHRPCGPAAIHEPAANTASCNPSPRILPGKQVFNGLRLQDIATHSKFPAQGSIIIPINDDIIHAAKICISSQLKHSPVERLQPLSIQKSLHYRRGMCLLCTGV